METGMLWFDNSKSDVEAQVRQAAAYYQHKYGKRPTKAFAPAGTPTIVVDGIQVESSPSVLKNHLWIGLEEA